MEKYCIAVLTRGYDDISGYNDLIKRNNAIYENLKNYDIDILIFHEGNILDTHQEYIINKTSQLRIKFIDIKKDNIAFKEEKKDIPLQIPVNWPLGYRHMCSFWFIDFWNFVEEYDYLLRIDEDCFINFNIDDLFKLMNTYYFVYGHYEDDKKYVTIGLNDFTLNFLKNEKKDKIYESRNASGPYTNVFLLNIRELRENELLMKYIKEVELSNKIYSHRWGDLPLWGEVIHYLFENNLAKLIDIKYYHGRHNKNINSEDIIDTTKKQTIIDPDCFDVFLQNRLRNLNRNRLRN